MLYLGNHIHYSLYIHIVYVYNEMSCKATLINVLEYLCLFLLAIGFYCNAEDVSTELGSSQRELLHLFLLLVHTVAEDIWSIHIV